MARRQARLPEQVGNAALSVAPSGGGPSRSRRSAPLPPELKERLAAIRAAVKAPIAAGFGISTKELVKMIGEGADGFIVGSALVKMLAKDGKIHPEELSF